MKHEGTSAWNIASCLIINYIVSIHKWLFSVPPSAGRQTQILILEILQCIPVVKTFVFLDLAKTISFLDGHYLILQCKLR